MDDLHNILKFIANSDLECLSSLELRDIYALLIYFKMEQLSILAEQNDETELKALVDEALKSVEAEIDLRAAKASNLEQCLIENPTAVECALSLLDLNSLLAIEQAKTDITCPGLQKQYAFMINRCLKNLIPAGDMC
jgi:hypothetical protein